MARIRTIKPEFWDSPDTARASLRARLFYIAMWNWADDYGKGTASAKQLIGFAFPNDADITVSDYPTLAKDVADCFGVVFYTVDRRPYYAIPSFPEHQRTEKRAKSRIPDPPEDVSAGQKPWDGLSDDSDGPSDDRRGTTVSGTGEQGNRGTGEVGKGNEPATQVRGLTPALTPAAELAIFDEPLSAQVLIAEWIDHCNERPPGRVIGQVSKELKNLLDEGIDPERVRRALAEWNRKGLHPSTLASVVHEISNRKPAARSQQATDDLFDRAMQRAMERDAS